VPSNIASGSLIADRYRLDKRIAGGGMGEVWRAVDDVLGRTVAIKFLRAELADDDQFRERLRREARSAGAISHAGVVPVFDYGEVARDNAAHLAYLVMEFVDGPSLAAELRAHGALGPERTLLIVQQTASALQSAHDAGVIHRDIKPANILVGPKGDVKIADFGISRAADSTSMTRTGTLTGTAHYLSPEQVSGKPATAASDIYSLGIVAYACLAGHVPFTDGNALTVALAHLHQAPPPLLPDVPVGLNNLVMGMLAKEPSDRPQSAGVVAATAGRLVHEAGPSVEGRHPFLVQNTIDGATPTRVGMQMSAPPVRKNRRLRPAAIAVAVLLMGGIATAFALGSSGTTVPSVIGEGQESGESRLAAEGLGTKVKAAHVAGKDAGVVLQQSALPGAEVVEGSTITLTVASGRVSLPIDDLLGVSYDRAVGTLKALGLEPVRMDQVSSSSAGTVIAVKPDDTAANGSTIDLMVATAPVEDEDGDSGGDGENRKDRRKGKDDD
jgi:serine/threonine-protein kinase